MLGNNIFHYRIEAKFDVHMYLKEMCMTFSSTLYTQKIKIVTPLGES